MYYVVYLYTYIQTKLLNTFLLKTFKFRILLKFLNLVKVHSENLIKKISLTILPSFYFLIKDIDVTLLFKVKAYVEMNKIIYQA
jgi:hypothetical protein